MNWMVIHLSFI